MSSKYENAEKFLVDLKKESGVIDTPYEVSHFCVEMLDAAGEANLEQDMNDSTEFNWTLTLGPVNSQKLIDFLKGLEAEPDEQDAGEALYDAAAKEHDDEEDGF